jgi:hypothetical protein
MFEFGFNFAEILANNGRLPGMLHSAEATLRCAARAQGRVVVEKKNNSLYAALLRVDSVEHGINLTFGLCKKC